MKLRFLLLLILFSLCAARARSQAVVGISGGLYTTDYYCSTETPHFSGTFKSHPGYCLALTFSGRQKLHLNPGIELAFVKKRLDANVQYGGLGYTINRDVAYQLDYLYISAFPEWTIGKKLVLSISAGPQFGFLIYSKISGNSSGYGGGSDSTWTDSGTATEDIIPMDIRLFLKVGISYSVSDNLAVAIESMAGIGISRIWKTGLESNSRMNSFDNSIRIGLIYRLNSLKLSQT
jgi:hypothetical protein